LPVYNVANIHSTETTGGVAACYLIHYLVSGYASENPVVRDALATRTFYVVPRVNPDGVEVFRAVCTVDILQALYRRLFSPSPITCGRRPVIGLALMAIVTQASIAKILMEMVAYYQCELKTNTVVGWSILKIAV
jgi:hypothetical protein